jgi:hypothetical protein
MEAKVDVRKLQLLNDRISQTIEALNQVRLSVHGLGHSSVGYGMNPFLQNQPFSPFPQTQGYGSLQGQGQNQGLQGFGMQNPSSIYGNPFQNVGLQHSPFTNPYLQLQQGQTGMTSGVFGGGTFPGMGQGLFHSNAEIRANDPVRISQTFPYVFSPQSPITW